jgi:hypothetical protein
MDVEWDSDVCQHLQSCPSHPYRSQVFDAIDCDACLVLLGERDGGRPLIGDLHLQHLLWGSGVEEPSDCDDGTGGLHQFVPLTRQ